MTDRSSQGDLTKKLDLLDQELSAQRQFAKQLKEKNRSLGGLFRLACLLNESKGLNESLQLIANEARTLLSSQVSCIALMDRPRGMLVIGGWSDERGVDLRERIFPVPERGIGASAIRSGEGLIRSNYFRQDEIDAVIDSVCPERANMSNLSTMVAPVGSLSDCLALIYEFRLEFPPFSEDQLEPLMLLRSLVGSEINRRRFEASLQESEERFRFMAETTGDVLYRLNYESMRYDYLSPGIFSLTGYDPEELQGIGFASLVKRIDLPGYEDVSQDMIKSRRLEGTVGEYRADYLIHTKQGAFRWLRDHSFPWLDEHSRVVGSVGILSDVSEYKQAENRLQERTDALIESEEKYRTLVENVPLVVYRMGSRQEILFVNGFFREVFGYSATEVFQNPGMLTERVYDDDQGYIKDLRKRSYEEGREFFAEYRVVHKDGKIVHILDHAVPYRTYDGRIASLDGIMVDMTDKARFQEHLLETQDIKTISEVSARLAHEIRNPLVSAGGFARLLLTHMDPDDPNRARAEIIVKEVGRLESILRMVLMYIQPLNLQFRSVDLMVMLGSILHRLKPEMRNKRIHLTLKLAEGMNPVSADPLQMERALEAIIRNAFNQIQVSGTLEILSFQRSKELLIHIKYPVEHLSRDDLDHFFYPFTSVTAYQTIPDLPLSKIIIHKHGGHAEVNFGQDGQLSIEILLPL
ncbi:MAG: two-component system, LuxR family, sensor kinase FixL [Thermodesulfobacteriota bacterium]|nr:two-component system, LuxR family, sensor kinase FixL [Thermodesulfobacteriota bacterium]